jgi:hypothetical protein
MGVRKIHSIKTGVPVPILSRVLKKGYKLNGNSRTVLQAGNRGSTMRLRRAGVSDSLQVTYGMSFADAYRF